LFNVAIHVKLENVTQHPWMLQSLPLKPWYRTRVSTETVSPLYPNINCYYGQFVILRIYFHWNPCFTYQRDHGENLNMDNF